MPHGDPSRLRALQILRPLIGIKGPSGFAGSYVVSVPVVRNVILGCDEWHAVAADLFV